LIVLCLIVCGSFFMAKGQDAILRRANHAYQELSFTEAIRLYEKALKNKFDKTAMIRLADCYRLTNQYELAAEQYAKVVDIKQLPPVNYFYFAQSLMNNGLFREAEKWFLRYAEAAPDDPRGLRFAESCRNIEGFYQDSSDYRLRPYRFNSEEDDFAPAWYRDGIIFASSRGEGEVVKSKYEWNDQPFLDLYFAPVDSSGILSKRPHLLNSRLNTRFHEGVCSVDEINQILYFTRNNYFKGKRNTDNNGVVNLKLFYSRLNEGRRDDLRGLPFNSNEYSVGHPAINPTGNVLYFVSDMPGGYGGTDLYRADRNGDGWSQPVNLGPVVNTPGNEMFPFVHADGTLFFASDGLGGIGGLDVYKVSLPLDRLMPPRNLGVPINSPSDDFGFVSSPDKLWGFVSSNRPGGSGGDDLYQFSVRRPGLDALVLDAKTLEPIPGALVAAKFAAGIEAERTRSNTGGAFSLLLSPDRHFRISVSSGDYAPTEQVFNTIGLRPGEMVRDTFYLDPPSLKVVFRVLDAETGSALPKVKVRIMGRDFEATSDSSGEVEFYSLPYPDFDLQVTECMPQQEPEYCFRFSDVGGLSIDTLPIIYEWNMGDGSRKRGLEVEHCYDAPGTYHVELNLVDTISGFLFMNQTGYDLEIRPPRGVYAAGPDTVLRGIPVQYDAGESYLPDCKIATYSWELDGENVGSGTVLERTFARTGVYEVALHVSGDAANGPQRCQKCVTRRITVIEPGEQLNKKDSLRAVWTTAPTTTPAVDIRCSPQEPENYCFRFSDEGGLQGDSLPFVYEWDMGDGNRRRGESVEHCFDHPGLYLVRLHILDPYTDRPLMVQSEYEVDVRDLNQVYVESYDSARIGQPFLFDALRSDPPENCQLKSVFWDFGDGTDATGPEVAHNYSRAGTYRVKMILSGKTEGGEKCEVCTYKEVVVSNDYQGYSYAERKRDESLIKKDYLGMEQMLFLEFSRPGFKTKVIPYFPSDTTGPVMESVRLERQLDELALEGVVLASDRKTPLQNVQLRLLDVDGNELKRMTTKTGAFSVPVVKGRVYDLLAAKEGYLSDRDRVGPVTEETVKDKALTLVLEPIVVGKSIVLKDIYYDFDKFDLRAESEGELMKVVKFLLDNPGIRVELGSHTDSRGADGYNLWLSQKRAESAVGFLQRKGLGEDRIVARGYGEQRLVNGCLNGVNCTEKGHQLNRRTEITIVGFSNSEYQEAVLVFGEEEDNVPKAATGVAIELGVFDKPVSASRLPEGDVRLEQSGGSYTYRLVGFANYTEAESQLAGLRAAGFTDVVIRSLADEEQNPAVDPDAIGLTSAMPDLGEADFYYTIQIAVLGRSTPEGYFAPLGEYRNQLQVIRVKNLNKYCVCRFAAYNQARKHLGRVKSCGFQDAFIVPYENGLPIDIKSALERERKGI
jgi:outer membrane protein OmpA-like peptidoglycan-associated protein